MEVRGKIKFQPISKYFEPDVSVRIFQGCLHNELTYTRRKSFDVLKLCIPASTL